MSNVWSSAIDYGEREESAAGLIVAFEASDYGESIGGNFNQ